MMGLTRRQRELLDFIGSYMAVENVAPSFEEMRVGLGLASKSGVHRLVTSLEERGFINRMPGRDRAIEVLETPRPVLRPKTSRPLIGEQTGTLIAELSARGFHIEGAAA